MYSIGVDAVSGDTSKQQLVIMFSALFLIPALVRSTYFWKGRVKKRKLKEKQRAQEEKASKIQKKRKEKQKADKIAEEKKKIEIQKAVEKENRELREPEIREKYGKEVLSAYRKSYICKGMPFSLVEELYGPGYEKIENSKFIRYKFGKYLTHRPGTIIGRYKVTQYSFQIDFTNENGLPGLCVDWQELEKDHRFVN